MSIGVTAIASIEFSSAKDVALRQVVRPSPWASCRSVGGDNMRTRADRAMAAMPQRRNALSQRNTVCTEDFAFDTTASG